MELTLSAQTQAFIYSCVLGVILAVVYTAMGIVKIVSPPSKKLLFVMDVLFMLVCTFATFFFSVAATWGSLRYYVVFGELIGFFLFYLFVGELILKCSKAITGFLAKIYFFLTNPFRKLFKKLFSFISVWLSKIKKRLKPKRKPKPKKKPKIRAKSDVPEELNQKPRIMAKPKFENFEE